MVHSLPAAPAPLRAGHGLTAVPPERALRRDGAGLEALAPPLALPGFDVIAARRAFMAIPRTGG